MQGIEIFNPCIGYVKLRVYLPVNKAYWPLIQKQMVKFVVMSWTKVRRKV